MTLQGPQHVRASEGSQAPFEALNGYQDRSVAGSVTLNRHQGRCRGQGRCGGRISGVAGARGVAWDAATSETREAPGRIHYIDETMHFERGNIV